MGVYIKNMNHVPPVETISSMGQAPTKASGMPLASKIFIAISILAIGIAVVYKSLPKMNFSSVNKVETTSPINKVLFNEKEVIVAKCNDANTIGLYLECGITQKEYIGIKDAVINIGTKALIIKGQELTFYIDGVKFMVYNCQLEKGVLIGKIKKV
jgi:hypothetical protein